MSKIFSQKLIATFFALLFSVAIFSSFIQADAPYASSKVSKSNKKAKKTKSGTEILSEVMDIVSSFGGEAVGTAIEDFRRNLDQTSELLQSLASEDTIESINFLIRNAISSLSETALKAASANDSSMSMQSSDFGEFLDSFNTALVKRCKAKANFSSQLIAQLEIVLPPMLHALSEMYTNVVDSTGFYLTFGMLSQGTRLLTFLERPEYVSKDTFKQFVNFPDEIQHQFETVIEDLISTYVDPTQLDMMLNMAKMYANSFASRRGEHEEL